MSTDTASTSRPSRARVSGWIPLAASALVLALTPGASAAGVDYNAPDSFDQSQAESPAPSATTPEQPKYAVPPPAVAPPATASGGGSGTGGSYGAPAPAAPSPATGEPYGAQPGGAAPEASPRPQPGVAAASDVSDGSESGSPLFLLLLVAVPVALATLLIVFIKRHPDWFARHGFGAR